MSNGKKMKHVSPDALATAIKRSQAESYRKLKVWCVLLLLFLFFDWLVLKEPLFKHSFPVLKYLEAHRTPLLTKVFAFLSEMSD